MIKLSLNKLLILLIMMHRFFRCVVSTTSTTSTTLNKMNRGISSASTSRPTSSAFIGFPSVTSISRCSSFSTKKQRSSSCSFQQKQTQSYSIPPITATAPYASHTRLFSTSSEAISDFFARPEDTFESIGVRSPVLLSRLQTLGLTRPSAVQSKAFQTILEGTADATIGAETGSGKTLAYLLPLIDDILQQKANSHDGTTDYDFCRAMILVPNKELVNQVVRMAEPLCGGPTAVLSATNNRGEFNSGPSPTTDNIPPSKIVRLAVMPGGLNAPDDFQPFRKSIALGGSEPPPDLVISTPASFGPMGLRPKHIDLFADIRTLVIDEADMLLDGGYIRSLEHVLTGFRRADKLDSAYGVAKTQHVFVAATLPDMGLRSVDAYLQKKFPYAQRISMSGMHNARHYGLRESTKWIEMEGNKERMQELVNMFEIPAAEGGLKDEKVMVFLNSVDDVEGANGALERAGIHTAKYHAKIPLKERTDNLDRFRNYTPGSDDNDDDAASVLVCTDLAARGLDVPGVSVVVQLQFAGNVVAHLHRMGRCGRAGQRTGRGIIFYDSKQQELIDVVKEAETQQERMVLEGDVAVIEELQEEATVKAAFSRKRGFTKKRKKIRREVET